MVRPKKASVSDSDKPTSSSTPTGGGTRSRKNTTTSSNAGGGGGGPPSGGANTPSSSSAAAPHSASSPRTTHIREEPATSDYIRVDASLIARSGLSESEVRELVEIFSLVDVDHGGTISKDELATLMKTLGLRVSKVELDTMVNEIDVAGTGEIDFESFVLAMSRKVQTSMTGEEIRKAFRMFEPMDIHAGGLLTMDGLVKILTDYGDKEKRMSKEEAEDLISQVAPQAQTGTFDYHQFIAMYFSKKQ
ncbi:Calmodulin-3 [Geranomyces michiganensis]|nr:Calmodulin-3 [Geranomyces michiganensis]